MCLLTEYIYEKLMKLPLTTDDLGCSSNGMLLGLNMPVSAPLDVSIRKCFAILIVKMLFGGIGQNFMNPALGGRVFLVN